MKTLVLALSLSICTAALASPLPAPQLTPGQYVYTIPPDWQPPFVSTSGIQQLNEAAKSLKYPFYIVFVKTLPNATWPKLAASNAVNGLAEDFSSQKGYDVARSSVFLLSFSPRQWRFVAGPEWQNRLGMTKGATRQFTSTFTRAVRNRPPNIVGGLEATMRSFDAYLWDQTDPVKVAARAKAAAEQLARTRLRRSEDALDGQLNTLANLFSEPKYLPVNRSVYLAAYTEGKQIREKDSIQSMDAETAKLAPLVSTLSSSVSAARAKADRKAAAIVLGLLLILGTITFGVIVLVKRREDYLDTKRQFDDEAKQWEEMVTNASANYTNCYLDRDDLADMESVQGETKKLYDQVTGEVNDIYLCIKGLEAHLAKCREMAWRGSALNPDPVHEARVMLHSSFDFDTGQVNQDELFGKETKHIRVNPHAFAAEQAERFKNAKKEWDKLKQAAVDRYQPLDSMFNTEHFEQAKKNITGRYARWLSEHPLFTLDQQLPTLNALRRHDPISAVEQAEDIMLQAALIEHRAQEVHDACENALKVQAAATELKKCVDQADTHFSSADDTTDIIKRSGVDLGGLLKLIDCAPLNQADAVCTTANKVTQAYRQAMGKDDQILKSVATAEQAIADCNKHKINADMAMTIAEAALKAAAAVHAENNVAPIRDILSKARIDMSLAQANSNQATEMAVNHYHLEAVRKAESAMKFYDQASDLAGSAKLKCSELDEKKQEFEEKQASARRRYEEQQAVYHSHGGQGSLSEPILIVNNNGAYDYGAALAQLAIQEAEWNMAIQTVTNAQSYAASSNESSWSSSDNDSGSSWASSSDDSGSSWDGSNNSDGDSW